MGHLKDFNSKKIACFHKPWRRAFRSFSVTLKNKGRCESWLEQDKDKTCMHVLKKNLH